MGADITWVEAIRQKQRPPDRELIVIIITLISALLVFSVEFSRRYTQYQIYERRIDVQKGVLSRIAYSVWAFEITEVIFTRSFCQVLVGTAAITLKVENNQPVRIAGITPAKEMKQLFENLRNRVLAERRDLKGLFV